MTDKKDRMPDVLPPYRQEPPDDKECTGCQYEAKYVREGRRDRLVEGIRPRPRVGVPYKPQHTCSKAGPTDETGEPIGKDQDPTIDSAVGKAGGRVVSIKTTDTPYGSTTEIEAMFDGDWLESRPARDRALRNLKAINKDTISCRYDLRADGLTKQFYAMPYTKKGGEFAGTPKRWRKS